MTPVAAEELLMFIQKVPTQSANDPQTVYLVNPKDPEDFQPLFLPDRPLSCESGTTATSHPRSSANVLSPVRIGECWFSATFHMSLK